MAAIPFGIERSEQPLGGLVELREEYADHLLAYVPSLRGPTEDLAGRRLSAVDLGRLAHSVGRGGIAGIGATRTGLQPTVAIPNPSAATLIAIQRVTAAGSTGWHAFQSDTGDSHFPFSGLWYTSTFSSARWLNGASISGYTAPHVAVVTARGTNRAAYLHGRLVGSTTSGGSIAISTQTIGVSLNTISYWWDGETYALILLPRELSAAEIAEHFRSPETAWRRLFRPIDGGMAPVSAGGGTGNVGSVFTSGVFGSNVFRRAA